MPHVVCVGDLMVDVLARLPGPLAVGSDTPAPVAFLGGGAAANVACWLASAAMSATFVGRVGADVAGREAITRLQESGVTPAVSVDPERPTGSCIVLVGPDGERTMVPSSGANTGLGSVDAATTLPDTADALYVSGYALLDPGARPFAIDAIAHGREREWLIAADAASAAPLAAAGADALGEWVGAPAVVFANDDEARVLTGATGADAARMLAVRFGEAVVKSGSAGSCWSDGSEVVHAPAPAAEVIDTTGAGDAFAAGFLSGRLAGDAPADWLRRGADLAARAVQTIGARPQLRS